MLHHFVRKTALCLPVTCLQGQSLQLPASRVTEGAGGEVGGVFVVGITQGSPAERAGVRQVRHTPLHEPGCLQQVPGMQAWYWCMQGAGSAHHAPTITQYSEAHALLHACKAVNAFGCACSMQCTHAPPAPVVS